MQKQHIRTLANLLIDNDAEYGDRDDAAMLLGESDDPIAEKVLIKVVLARSTDADLAETCGESLGEIWSRKRSLDLINLRSLKGMPLLLALGVIETRKPKWKDCIQNFRKQEI